MHKVAQSQTLLKRLSSTVMVIVNSGLERVSQMNILGKSLPRRLASKCKGLGWSPTWPVREIANISVSQEQ